MTQDGVNWNENFIEYTNIKCTGSPYQNALVI